VRARRPEVAAILAAVVERATAKDLRRRYSSDEQLTADLEDALAIETARAGAVSGEATAVLRTLPRHARRRLPLRLRHPGWLAGAVVLAVALAAGVAVELGRQAQRGTGTSGAGRLPALRGVSLAQDAAKDFDPLGDGAEHPDQTSAVLDRDPNTSWSTEIYRGGVINKSGVGIYVDARPGVHATVMQVKTDQPGWTAEVYAAGQGPPQSLDGWTRVSPSRDVTENRGYFRLAAGNRRFRYYLLWITKLPPSGQARISEIYLLRPR